MTIPTLNNLTPKQFDFLKNGNARLNILDGAVRSGKTSICNLKFIIHILNHPFNQFLLTGTTITSIKRNVLYQFLELLDEYTEYEFVGHNSEILIHKLRGDTEPLNKRIFIVGTGKEDAIAKIKGMTVAGWYADEITETPKQVIDMCLSRCSQPASRIYWTTNPHSPYHYVYTDYISRAGSQREDGSYRVKRWQFTIYDNTYLDKNVIDDLIEEYSYNQTAYERYILGKWVVSEGRIYDSFDKNKHTLPPDTTIQGRRLLIGADYGMSSPTAFIATIIDPHKSGNKYYVVDSEYHDPVETHKQKADREKAEDIKKLYERVRKKYDFKKAIVYLPHDARSLLLECHRHSKIPCVVKTYQPDTLDSIYKLQNLFAQNRINILDTKNNQKLIEDIQLYSWDSKKQQAGIDSPLKQNDHTVDALRLSILPEYSNRSEIII